MNRGLLQYQSEPTLMGSAFERSRASRLRRGLMRFTAILGGLKLIGLLMSVEGQVPAILALLGGVVVAGWGFWWSRRWKPRTPGPGLRMAGWVVLLPAAMAATAEFWIEGRIGTGLSSTMCRHLLMAAFLPITWAESAVLGGALFVLNFLGLGVMWLLDRVDTWRVVEAGVFSTGFMAPGVLLNYFVFRGIGRRIALEGDSQAYRTLTREMDGARRVHEACLAQPIERGPVRLHYVYQPFRQLGGDLLYVHPRIPSGVEGFLMVLLDVAGHGIAAALTVNRLVGELERMIAAACERSVSAEEVAHGLNRYVRLTLASHGLFATALIVRVMPGGMRLQWVNCGHPVAFLVTRGGGMATAMESETMMLGVTEEEEMGLQQHETPFGPGSALVACTDGATEARGPDGQALRTAGFGRLVTAVAGAEGGAWSDARSWPALLASEVAYHRDGPADDDLLLVALIGAESEDEVYGGGEVRVEMAAGAEAGGRHG